MSMHGDNFLELGEMVGVAGSDKGQRERWGSAQFGAHFFGRRADARFVETVQNKA
jgi:hypothetical protein